ncbi:heavy metal translocating P-type ATPase [Chlorobaculum parvum NCIB 8327]|uniref:Heavy metal translocating P-type ATPase n=1 Tax=Chlorobaculum parvum (strain DSM 263 / NCIMB 8327) TaxID=517417 RepID=B3QQ56_CHLP8|nr:heavy metal translocating P-type ATPase [Chlorobaculum parvum]ACF12059.1 heavy metal translocating P-type ATPase [Chlorobaculum parvum NCIB 8327]
MSVTERRNKEKLHCDHCQQEMEYSAAVTAVIDGQTRYFCCHGCLGVYELIHSESLDAFYQQRCDWQPGRPAFGKVDAREFEGNVRNDGSSSKIDLLLSGIRCASCVWLVEKALARLDGIVSARVNYATHRATIQWRTGEITLETILNTLAGLGYLPRPVRHGAQVEAFTEEKRDLLLRFGTAGFFSMQLMLIIAALYAGFFQGIETTYRLTFQIISWALATPVVFYSGWPFISNALRSLRNRSLNMDALVALGSLSAYFYSVAMIFTGGEVFFDTSAMIITFILLGRFLEAGSRLKAGSALAALADLQPSEALLVGEDGHAAPAPLEQINAGAVIEVLPGGRVPLDGTVTAGESDVDESMLTGESAPVAKAPGSTVYAGTLAITGRLLVSVTGNAHETLLSGIIRTVEEAQARKAPIQGVADRVAGWFVPAIILLAAGTFAWWRIDGAPTVTALMTAVSVLVIACPCALGLATPLAILVGTTAVSRKGILVKGGDIFETVSKTTTVVLDKTGTITRGKPSVTDTFDYGISNRFMQCCASLEAWSSHPAGQAITDAWLGERLPLDGLRVIPGMGVSGKIEGETWLAGSRVLLEKKGVTLDDKCLETTDRLEAEGKTTVLVACNGHVAGLFGLIDDLRDDAERMIEALRAQGLGLMILTGDNAGVARYIAEKCGITQVRSGLDPLGKAEAIRELKRSGETVLMAGDGINDAPALTEADTGVSFGTATAVAIDSAGVTIMNDDLTLLDTLVAHSRRCFAIIRQNLAWAFGYNLIALPLAVTGVLHPIVSALLMATSSLVVVSNSLRLRKL